jgi:hypothetical protein
MLKVDFPEISILLEFYQNQNFPTELILQNFLYQNWFLLWVSTMYI